MPDKDREPDMEDLIRLSVFSSIGTSIVAESTLRGVLNRVMENIGSFFGPLNWSLLLVDIDKDELVFSAAVGRSSEKVLGMRIPITEGVAGWVATHGVPAVIEDVDADSRWSDRLDRSIGFRTESIIAVPLRSGKRVFGVIELLNRLDGGKFSAFHMRVLSTIADFAAIAIEKAYYLAEARRLSECDPLTGVLNRRGLAKAADRERTRISRYGGNLSVIMADVDRFKSINDTHGHAAGDEVLKAVAAAIQADMRNVDSVARYGGDEFLALMPATGLEEAEIARARLQARLDKVGKEHAVPFSVTLGVHTSQDLDFDELFKRSDQDLYRRKAGLISLGENLLATLEAENREGLDETTGTGGAIEP